jgi:arylsulfatase A-like enzyme
MTSLLAMLLAALPVQAGVEAELDRRPNVVLLMSDDQGLDDVGYYGNGVVQTPHLDSMASAGVRFDRFYAAAPLCSPTRGSCLTGRHPFRYGITEANVGKLPADEITLAELLAEAGYATGHFGKWHLGTMTTEEYDSRRGGPASTGVYSPPWEHGFEVCFSTEAKVPTYDPLRMPLEPEASTWWTPAPDEEHSQPYHSKNEPSVAYWSGPGQKVEDALEGDDSRVIMDRVVPFVREATAAQRPFFAVVWFHAAHKPVVAGPEHTAPYAALDGYQRSYYGCITAMDEQIGRLRAELRELGVAERTLVWFCSDNGPFGDAETHPGSAGTLRGRKGDLYEGGLRVPAVLEWPGRFAGGSTAVPASTSDMLPTVLELIGLDFPADRPLDGISLLPVLDGRAKTRGAPLAFQSELQLAWIDGRFKLHTADKGRTFALYDLLDDPDETTDRAAAHEERVASMRAALLAWRDECMRDSQSTDGE